MTETVVGKVDSIKQFFENQGRTRKISTTTPPQFSQARPYSTPDGFERSQKFTTRPSNGFQDEPTDRSDNTSCSRLNQGGGETAHISRLSNVPSNYNRSLSVDNINAQTAERSHPPPVKAKPKISLKPLKHVPNYSFSRLPVSDSVANVTATTAFHPPTTWNVDTSIASSSGVSSGSTDSTAECNASGSYNSSSASLLVASRDLNGVSARQNNSISSTNPLSENTSGVLQDGSFRGMPRSKVQSYENIQFTNTILVPSVNKEIGFAPINGNGTLDNRKPKKPPPVPKKTFSLRSGSAASISSQSQHQDDKELEKYGVKTKTGSYEYTENWAAAQGLRRRDGRKESVETNSTSSEVQRKTSGTSTPSAPRSILKSGPRKGPRSKKSISFKGDDELETSFNYPSEQSRSEDSFDLGSDEDCFLQFDQKSWENPPSSSCSTLVSDKDTVRSSSTLQGRSSSRGFRPGSPTLELGSSASNYSSPLKRYLPEARRSKISN